MEIFMFIMFMSTNIFMILILKYSCDGNYHYNNGMILGVHIPSEHSGDEEVTALAQKEYKNFKRFLIINLILSTASCLFTFWNMIISVFIYIIWILGFSAALSILSVSSHRRMYAMKEKNGWIIESQKKKVFIDTRVSAEARKSELLSATPAPIYVDDDEYWKSGFYYNPNDPHMLVPNRLQNGNYAFNYANRGARIITAGLTVFIAASFIFTIAVLVPFVNVRVDIRTDESRLHVAAAGYSSDIDMNSITDVQILDELPDDGFSKINGGATDTYLVGRFKGNTYGYCNLYIYTGHTPVLMVKTDSETVFFNSDIDGKLQEIYDELSHNKQSSSQFR